MKEKSFFRKKVGHQTIAGIVTVSALPFLYLGGQRNINLLLFFGIFLVLLGMMATPVITYLHDWNTDKSVENIEQKNN